MQGIAVLEEDHHEHVNSKIWNTGNNKKQNNEEQVEHPENDEVNELVVEWWNLWRNCRAEQWNLELTLLKCKDFTRWFTTTSLCIDDKVSGSTEESSLCQGKGTICSHQEGSSSNFQRIKSVNACFQTWYPWRCRVIKVLFIFLKKSWRLKSLTRLKKF